MPQPFLAKLLQKLIKADIVSSTKGPNGGFFLGKKNVDKTVWDIVICTGSADKFDQCFLGLAKCGDESPCPVHYSVSPFKDSIKADFKDKTIIEFAKEIKNSDKVISLKDFDILDH